MSELNITEISMTEFKKDIYHKYTELFPKNEQRYWKEIKLTYKNGVEHFYKINLDDKTIGFIMLERIDNNPYYLEYFAIYKEYQNKGYGSKAIKKLINDIIHNNGLICDIEKVDNNNIQTKKRMDFYKKLGFKKINSEYLLFNVKYTPIVYLNDLSKEQIDEIFFKYYFINVGEKKLYKNCKIIK